MLSAYATQYLSQLGGITTFVEINDEDLATAHKLIPTSGWHNGQQYPHDINKELKHSSLKRLTREGIEYYLVPDNTINAQGVAAHYVRGAEASSLEVQSAEPPVAVEKYLKASKRKIQRIG